MRELYSKAYSFITLTPEQSNYATANLRDLQREVAELMTKMASQKVLEAKLGKLEDELERLRKSYRVWL